MSASGKHRGQQKSSVKCYKYEEFGYIGKFHNGAEKNDNSGNTERINNGSNYLGFNVLRIKKQIKEEFTSEEYGEEEVHRKAKIELGGRKRKEEMKRIESKREAIRIARIGYVTKRSGKRQRR